MRLICGTCSAPQDASDEVEPRCGVCGAVLQELLRPPRSLSGLPLESWLLRTAAGESGPHSADDVARLMTEGACDWTTEVIRDGLSGFRAARRDALLVMAVARARGLDGATQPVGSMRALPQPEAQVLDDADLHDTWVDARPSLPELQGIPMPTAESGTLALSPEALQSAPPTTTAPLVEPAQAAELRESTAQVALRRSVAGNATDVVYGSNLSSPPKARRAGGAPWVTPWVALAAFLAGGIFALAPAQLVELTQNVTQGLPMPLSARRASEAQVAAGVVVANPPAAWPAAPPLSPPPGAASAAEAGVEFVRRSLPARAELRAELDRLSPPLRRCMRDPSRGVDLDLVIVGKTGQIDDVRVGTPALTPGAIECIRDVFADFHVAPFVTPELRLAQRYRW